MTKKIVSEESKLLGKDAAFEGKVSCDMNDDKGEGFEPVQEQNVSDTYNSYVQKLEEEIDLLTSYASDTIYRLHYETMKYDYISPTVIKLLGFSQDEMKLINFRSLILETRIVTNGLKSVYSFNELEQIRKKGDVNQWQADYLVRTKDGRKIWISDVSSPWFDESGKVIGSVGSLRDITDRVNAENQARKDIERFANTDSLTGVANRREFFKSLDKELKRISRSEEDVSMLLVDVDHFRNISDNYGAVVGDKVLVEVSKIIKSCLRETDVIARLGGEEFGVLLPDTNYQGAYWVAERIRTAVLSAELLLGIDNAPIGSSVSIGVSFANSMEEKLATNMYKEADTRLYIAKNTGKNQVSVDEIMHTH